MSRPISSGCATWSGPDDLGEGEFAGQPGIPRRQSRQRSHASNTFVGAREERHWPLPLAPCGVHENSPYMKAKVAEKRNETGRQARLHDFAENGRRRTCQGCSGVEENRGEIGQASRKHGPQGAKEATKTVKARKDAVER